MDHPGFKLHWETSWQQKIIYLLLYAWTEQVRDLNAFLFAKPYSLPIINNVVIYPSWPLASEDVFECHFLLVIDHTHHRSKVGRKFAWRKKYNSRTYFACFYRNSWPVTPYVKSIGYWVSMCYCLVFYCILEYCVILSLKKTFSNNQTRSSMDFGEESNEEKRIRIALKIEKISRICVPIYLLSFSVGYFMVMSNFNFWKICFLSI